MIDHLIVNYVVAVALTGQVTYCNVLGRIGITIGQNGRISHVHPFSPAAEAGLLKNDRVRQVDHHQKLDIDDINGDPGTSVSLTVERDHNQFEVNIERVDYRTIRKD